MINIYIIQYPGSYMGGNAVVRATNRQDAYDRLKKHYTNLDPIEKCVIKRAHGMFGVLYNWDGDY